MVELVFICAIGVIVLFAGLTVLMNGSFQVSAIFIFLTLLIGYIVLILTYRKRKQLKAAIRIIYQGYEKYLYYGSMAILFISGLLIYLGHLEIQSMISPVLIVDCFVPLTGYLSHESLLTFYEKDFHYNGQVIRYKDVRSLEVFDYKKNKKKMVLYTREKEIIYTGRNQAIEEAQKAFVRYCRRMEVRENL